MQIVLETNCMKDQTTFYGKDNSNLSFAKLAQRVLRVENCD